MTERKQGQHGPIDHPNMRQEQFCKEALILNVEPLREHQAGRAELARSHQCGD